MDRGFFGRLLAFVCCLIYATQTYGKDMLVFVVWASRKHSLSTPEEYGGLTVLLLQRAPE